MCRKLTTTAWSCPTYCNQVSDNLAPFCVLSSKFGGGPCRQMYGAVPLDFNGSPTSSNMEFNNGLLIGRRFTEDQPFRQVVLKANLNFNQMLKFPKNVNKMDILFEVKIGNSKIVKMV